MEGRPELDFVKQVLKDHVGSCAADIGANPEHVDEAHAAAHALFSRIPLLEHCDRDELLMALHDNVRAMVRSARRAGLWTLESLAAAKEDESSWNELATAVFNRMAHLGADEMQRLESPLQTSDPKFMRYLDRQWLQLCAVALSVALQPITSPLNSLTSFHLLHLMSVPASTAPLHAVRDVLFSCITNAVSRLPPVTLPLLADAFSRFKVVFHETLSLKCREIFDGVLYLNPFGVRIARAAAVCLFSELFSLGTNVIHTAITKLESNDLFVTWPASVSELYILLQGSSVITDHVPRIKPDDRRIAVQKSVQRRNTVLRALQLAFQDDRGVHLRSFPIRSGTANGWDDYVSFVVFKCFDILGSMLQHKCNSGKSLRSSTRKELLGKIRARVLHKLACLGLSLAIFKRDSGKTTVANQLDALACSIGDDMVFKDEASQEYVLSFHPLLRVFSDSELIDGFWSHQKKAVVCTSAVLFPGDSTSLHQSICEPVMPWKPAFDPTCCHAMEPLCTRLALDTADHVCLAFAAPTPQMLFDDLGGCRWDNVLLVSTACIWNLAFVARRTLKSLHAVAPLSDHPLATCVSCLENLPSWSLCSDHPACLHCLLSQTEGVLADALSFRKSGDEASLFKCAFPACPAVALSFEQVSPWLSPEMVACYKACVHRRHEITCAVCLCVLPASEDGVVAYCSVCESATCLQCGRSSHPGTVCSAAYRRQFGLTVEDVLSDASKQTCSKCTRAVVKDAGCNHMTCLCGNHWCWQCGIAIDPLNPSAHFRDVVGGTRTATCSQFVEQDEASRVRKRILQMDIATELREQALQAIA
jgi:hypothetical protein